MAKQVKQCKYCGLDGFYWTRTLQGWRLTDPSTGALHQCAPTKVSLLQTAIDMGLNPDIASGMRLRDLKDWVDENGEQPTATDEQPAEPVWPEFIPAPETPVVLLPEPIATPVPEGWAHVHPNFHKSVRYFKALASANQWWAGPAGSGKTTLAKCIADALGKTLCHVSVSKNIAEFDLLGYMDGHGRYVPGKLYEALRGTDKVVLIDECDRGNDGVLVVLNGALDQRYCTFPNGETVHIDPSVLFIATGNTWGRGADAVYTAAGALDAAFLDRFQVKLAHDYDEDFERKITSNLKWTRYVQRIRKAVFDLRLQGVVISPRASRDGGAFIDAGIPWAEVEQDVLWSAIPVELQASVREKLGLAA